MEPSASTESKHIAHQQAVFAKDGHPLINGAWDPRVLAGFVRSSDIEGATVLDIGCNTGGFSLELARMGGIVTAADPHPTQSLGVSQSILERCAEEEGLSLTLSRADLFTTHTLGRFDVVICFGLLYHFREPQYVLDYLSGLAPKVLYLSSQTHPGGELALYNRAQPGILRPGHLPADMPLTGWHPTRALLERMLQWAGFSSVEPVSPEHLDFPNKPKGATNSAYYRAEHRVTVDAITELTRFRPR